MECIWWQKRPLTVFYLNKPPGVLGSDVTWNQCFVLYLHRKHVFVGLVGSCPCDHLNAKVADMKKALLAWRHYQGVIKTDISALCIIPRVWKKVWCQYFMNGAIQVYECNILRHSNYNFYLGMFNVSIQYVKTKVMTTRRMMGQKGLVDRLRFRVNLLFDSLKSHLTHHSCQVHNFC